MSNPLASDLNDVLLRTQGLWEPLRGNRLFVTGGTGFFGCWLLESFLWANDQLQLDAQAFVLTRDPDAFRCKAPHLAGHSAIQLIQGDVRDFKFPSQRFRAVLHVATVSSSHLDDEDPLVMLDVVVNGTRRALDFAVRCEAESFLLASSGLVYGRQPPDLSHVSEEYGGGPQTSDIRSANGEGKRAAELLCAIYNQRYGLPTKVARGFVFVGPYLPLGRNFAVGNFIGDVLGGQPIRVKGDGTPYRSYLYAADLAVWLWTILFRGEPGRPYNVGSETAVSIRELADLVARTVTSPLPVMVARMPVPGVPPERYVPSTQRARLELGLREYTDLAEALRRTFGWHEHLRAAQRGGSLESE